MTAEEQKMVDMLVQTNHELAAQVQELSNRIAQLQRMLFGRRSEKMPLMDPNQMSLFDEPIAPEVVQDDGRLEGDRADSAQTGRCR